MEVKEEIPLVEESESDDFGFGIFDDSEEDEDRPIPPDAVYSRTDRDDEDEDGFGEGIFGDEEEDDEEDEVDEEDEEVEEEDDEEEIEEDSDTFDELKEETAGPHPRQSRYEDEDLFAGFAVEEEELSSPDTDAEIPRESMKLDDSPAFEDLEEEDTRSRQDRSRRRGPVRPSEQEHLPPKKPRNPVPSFDDDDQSVPVFDDDFDEEPRSRQQRPRGRDRGSDRSPDRGRNGNIRRGGPPQRWGGPQQQGGMIRGVPRIGLPFKRFSEGAKRLLFRSSRKESATKGRR